MPTYYQTHEELKNQLSDQLTFLRASCASFDSGFEEEAKRLATTIRVLVHDTKDSKSLLQLMQRKGTLRMHNTALPFNPRNLAPHQSLVVTQLEVPEGVAASVSFNLFEGERSLTGASPNRATARAIFKPRVHESGGTSQPRTVSFNEWWEEVVIKDNEGSTFTRKDLVLTMANKDGGAHVDPKLDEQYARLTRFHSQGWLVMTEGIRRAPNNSLVAASVRQITHELLVSIEQSVPEAGNEKFLASSH